MRLFFAQLGWELFRMFARKRTYIGFGIFLAVELLFWRMLTLEKAKEGMIQFTERLAGAESYFSGITIAFLMVFFTVMLLGATFVALVSGDIVAKETEDGNLRLLLARPISRLRLLAIKFLACQIYTTVLFWFVGLTALIVGILERGWGGGFFAWDPRFFALQPLGIYDWWEGIRRYFAAITGFSLLFLPITGIAFMLGCFKIKPAAATIITIAFITADFIFASIPLEAFEPYQHLFITSRMEAWLLILQQEIPWAKLVESAIWLVGIGLTGFIIGWVVFERRDVKS
ncbi:MAG: ABC transporter permease subunit [Verrucomicrobiales bacterium]|nr:ABC transporter permease subunit [Verrucomicrobiales bacterium]